MFHALCLLSKFHAERQMMLTFASDLCFKLRLRSVHERNTVVHVPSVLALSRSVSTLYKKSPQQTKPGSCTG